MSFATFVAHLTPKKRTRWFSVITATSVCIKRVME